MNAIGRKLRIGVALVLACATTACLAGTAEANPVAPASDPFYTYSGSLQQVAPGAVLRARAVTIAIADTGPGVLSGTQVLYRTTNQLGEPSVTAATIIAPAASAQKTKLLSYQTAYDGVSSTCRPSFQLQGGTPTNSIVTAESALILAYVQQGFTVVTSDYEGPTDDYGAGREEGYNTLDAIRAAEHRLGLAAKTTPVGLLGYSGGSIASMWASELQPGYAPELDVNAVAAGGIPVDFTHNLAYIDGSSDWAGAIPAVGIGLMRAYKLDLAKYLNARGAQIASQVEQGCLNATAYPGLTFADLLKPEYQDWQKVPIFVRIFNDTIMGRTGTPTEPLLMGVGNADGTGDGVMVAKDVQQLAYSYCQRGVNIQFHIYNGDDHVEALPQFETQALTFLQLRYNGQSVASGCSSITAGNPLTPLATPTQTQARPSSPRLKLRYLGANARRRGLALRIWATRGVLRHVTVELKRGTKVEVKATMARLTRKGRRLVLRVRHRIPARGRHTLVVLIGRATALHRTITVR
jgi:Secretory lipase